MAEHRVARVGMARGEGKAGRASRGRSEHVPVQRGSAGADQSGIERIGSATHGKAGAAGKELGRKPTFLAFVLWIVGDTPLIVHSWSEKHRREMLAKQVKAVRPGRIARNPHEDFVNSLYHLGDGNYGFPSTGVKNAILSSAHRDKGIARTSVLGALWVDAQMVRTRPAFSGSICDLPLLRIYGSAPENREDMVRVGVGLSKKASLAYRGQFTIWAMRVTGRFNASVLNEEQLGYLIDEAGMASGLGEWRNERKGMFGAFHRATAAEEEQWEAFKAGTGPLPVPESYKIAAE